MRHLQIKAKVIQRLNQLMTRYDCVNQLRSYYNNIV